MKMGFFEISAVLVSLAAAFAYLNYRFLKWPATIGLMTLALIHSFLLLLLGAISPDLVTFAKEIVTTVRFDETLLHGMLGFLLFAGALHIDIRDLREERGMVGIMATLGIFVSTLLIGTGMFFGSQWLQVPIPFIFCLLLGAILSPTDPIAVMGILKIAGAPKSLETKIAGESLFNDGVAVVLYIALIELCGNWMQLDSPTETLEIHWGHLGMLFFQEMGLGILLGLILGWGGNRLLSTVDDYVVEILITLAIVFGGYALALALHWSGPIAVVVAGLMIGNHGRNNAMSPKTRNHLDMFWHLIDEVLNAVLFLLIGLEIVILSLNGRYLLAGAIAVVVTLVARGISVGLPLAVMRRRRAFAPHAWKILTWGGLRGGISVALALALGDQFPSDEFPEWQSTLDLMLTITYVVVVFSILVQGLSLKPLLERWGVGANKA